MGDQHLKGVISFQCYSHLFSAMNGISLQVFNPLPLISGKEVSNLLIWGDWNIIFSYMTYFNRQIEHDHFMQLAADVVQSGLAAISHYSEGFLIWKSSKINAEYFDIERESFVRMESAKFTFPEGLNPYQMQCALHAAQLRFFDHRHLSPMVAKEMLYFRAFLDPCELKIQGRILRFYPHITVHQNGVFQMHFRMISGGSLVSTREFINDFLNSPMSPADDILLPPALMRLDGRKLLFGDEYYDRRITRLHEWSRLEDVIDKFTFYAEGEPDSFSHNFISIDPEGKSKGPPVSLTTLTVMLGNALETLLNQPRMGWKYQFLGPKKARYTQGNFWSGVPAVYLLSMKDHPYMASEIHEKYASDLSHIMIRSKDIPTTHAGKHLGESLRLSEDYLCYSGTAVNLFVYSRSGIEDHDETDPNVNELVYALQSQVDFADFINGSLWQCEERALLHARTVEELINNRERQTFYDYASRHPFHYGELNDWFAVVQKSRNMDATRASIAFNTTLNLEKFKERRNFRRQQFQWLMAALLGVIAAGTSGGKLVSLIWEGMGGTPQTEFLYAIMAMIVVASIFSVSYRVFVEPHSVKV